MSDKRGLTPDEHSAGNFAQYHQQHSQEISDSWVPSPPPPGNYGGQTPNIEKKPYFSAQPDPEEVLIRSNGPGTVLR